MPLVLTPALTDMSRAEIEEHRDSVRARRMMAAIVYHEGKNAKYHHHSTVLKRRLDQQYDMLAKDIARLDKADEALTKRLHLIDNLANEKDLNDDAIIVLDKSEEANSE